MRFNAHSELEGKHSFLSPSKYSWLRYDEDKLIESFRNHMAHADGTEQHELAAVLIKRGLRLKGTTQTLTMYVNDAISFGMSPEVALFYSWNAFGTTDAILSDAENMILRIHDLKTGVSKASFDQLIIYVALFCLEYNVPPATLNRIVLRIYQNDDIQELEPDLEDVMQAMSTMVEHDKIINRLRAGEIF